VTPTIAIPIARRGACGATLQGRLPQELRNNQIADYAAANRYLEQVFILDFKRRFTVTPAQALSAFVKLAGLELELVLSSRHEPVVRNDNPVTFAPHLPARFQNLHFSTRAPSHESAGGKMSLPGGDSTCPSTIP